MNNSGASESTEISNEASNTQHTSGVATSERGFNQQKHTLQDIENPNLEGVAGAASTVIGTYWERLISFILKRGEETEICRDPIESMYRAALEGDWVKAEKLLKKDPTLAYQERKGHRPLHVAVALKHDKFARKLIERVEPSMLELKDSNYITACGYAAASGNKDIAKLMIKKNPKLVEQLLSLVLFAFSSRKSEMVLFFLKQTEWKTFEEGLKHGLLVKAIVTKMNDVALTILEKDASLATKRIDDEGTALHVLARQDISAASTGKLAMIFKSIFGTTLNGLQGHGKMPPDFRSLAKKLLANIQEMDESSALELLKNPPILHDAAKVGNMELILLLTRAYPDLIWHTDDKGRSLFHIAIESRETNVFSFMQRYGALDNTSMFEKGEKEGNLLHLAAKLGPRKNAIPALEMQSELAWYMAVEAMLPQQFIEKKNDEKQTPRDLFVATHKELLKESKEWMKSTADSCMLIATIILTVVYAAAFTVPGGNNEATGLPILVKSNWLTCFFIFEALALFSSTLCIITFWSMITCSGFEEDQFLNIIPYQLRLGFSALFSSLIGAIAAFLSAYHMVLVEGKARLVKFILLCICVILFLAILGRFRELWYKTKLPKPNPPPTSENNIPGPYSTKDMTDEDKGELDPGEDNLLNVDCTL